MKRGCFSLDPPPGFQPFDPRGALSMYQRRLPHWRQDGVTYLVTFRLADSLPVEKLTSLESLKDEWTVELARLRSDGVSSDKEIKAAWEEFSDNRHWIIETWLDQGIGECLLRRPELRSIVREALEFAGGEDPVVDAAVIMPNHVHALIRPGHAEPLERFLQRRKRHSAREINRASGRSGPLWQDESYDRIVRDSDHLWQCLQYIGGNPRKAGLQDHEFTRWVREDWAAGGWKFVDGED